MDKSLISIEYCHVTPEVSWEDEIHRTNTSVQQYFTNLEAGTYQKCIMIDDIHSKTPVTTEFINAINSKLRIKPDTIYLESEFIKLAQPVLDGLDRERVTVLGTSERTWLRSLHNRYDSKSEFALKWSNKDEISFACPTLAATSYLARLGAISNAQPIWGEPIKSAGVALQILSSRYLSVESNAQLIVRAYDEKLVSKLQWIFY